MEKLEYKNSYKHCGLSLQVDFHKHNSFVFFIFL